MALELSALKKSMVTAARESLATDWPKARDFADAEFRKLAQSLKDIAVLAADGKVNGKQAKALLQIHANTTRMVLLTVKGLAKIAVDKAINAALGAVREAVNAAAGIAIL
jgi:hypothetical protein